MLFFYLHFFLQQKIYLYKMLCLISIFQRFLFIIYLFIYFYLRQKSKFSIDQKCRRVNIAEGQ